MGTRGIFAAGLIAATMGVSMPSWGQVRDYREIQAPPLRPFTVQQPRRVELPNGMVLLLQEDRELPLIRGTAMVRGGSRDVPAGKTGLASIYGEVWRTGGTTRRTGDDMDDFLEARAAKIETNAGSDITSISFDVMKNQLDAVFPLFVELLREPAFREDKIALAKRQQSTAIARRNDDVTGIAAREAARLVWGADSPYARIPEYATIEAIQRDDLLAWHKRYVHPNNIILGVVGDFDARQMESTLRKAFGSWSRGPQASTPDIPPQPAAPGVYFIPKDDVTQTVIRMVHPGTRRDNPDYYALEVMNEIFSGGFSGRLLQRIRSDRGLAYSVGGRVGTGWDRPGVFQMSMGTKSESTVEAVEALLAEVEDLQRDRVSEAEIDQAKRSLLNSFVFTVDSKRKVLGQRMDLELYGYPADFYDRYRAGIERVTIDDVHRVANEYVHPQRLAILVVGREADFDRPLTTLGEVTPIDITIPPLHETVPIAGDDQGMAIVQRVREFVGGAALDGIEATRSLVALTVMTPQGEMQVDQEVTLMFPDRVLQVMKTPMGEITMAVSPGAAFMSGPMGSQDLPGSQRDALLQELRQDMVYVLKSAGEPGFSFAAGGTETVGDIEAAVLDIDAGGASMRWIVDPATGRILRKVARRGPVEQIIEYADWEVMGGVRIPRTVTVTSGGERVGSASLTSFEVNPAIDPDLFVKK